MKATKSVISPLPSATKSKKLLPFPTPPLAHRARRTKQGRHSRRKAPASPAPAAGAKWAGIPLTTAAPARASLAAQLSQQERGAHVLVPDAQLATVIPFPSANTRKAKKNRGTAVKAVKAVQAADLRRLGPKAAAAKGARSGRGNFQHDLDREGGKSEWITPLRIIRALKLRDFDLDPCAPTLKKRLKMPPALRIAKASYSIDDDGLASPWFGRVFCNPPYGLVARKWLAKCAEHGNCVALVYARTETRAFQDFVWEHATALLFIDGRLKFHHVDGREGGTAGAPNVLIAFGENNAQLLKKCKLRGAFVRADTQRPSERRAATRAA